MLRKTSGRFLFAFSNQVLISASSSNRPRAGSNANPCASELASKPSRFSALVPVLQGFLVGFKKGPTIYCWRFSSCGSFQYLASYDAIVYVNNNWNVDMILCKTVWIDICVKDNKHTMVLANARKVDDAICTMLFQNAGISNSRMFE
jgi:hypothetical protein